MGSINGQVEAKCKECMCIFTQNVNNWIFIDIQIIGTCDNCFSKISHKCIDKLHIDENEQSIITGEKIFTIEETNQRKIELENAEYVDYE